MRYAFFVAVLYLIEPAATAMAADEITGSDFVTSFRQRRGETVIISDCRIGGTTASFIRCETANRSASYSLEADTMDPAHLKWALDNCPTGSINKQGCQIRVQGIVTKRSQMPGLDGARIIGVSG